MYERQEPPPSPTIQRREADEDGVYVLLLMQSLLNVIEERLATCRSYARRCCQVAGTEDPPQAFRHGIEQLEQILGRLEYFSRPPDADDAADHRQQDHAVDHI